MIKRMILMLLMVGLLAVGIYAFQSYKSVLITQALKGFATAPQTVSTETVKHTDWQTSLQAVGTLRAARGVDLATEVSGIIEELNFESGKDVAENDQLLRLRPNDNTGRLKQFEAAVDLAQITYRRDMQQLRAQAIAQATLDTDLTNLKSAQAQVEQQKAVLNQRIIRAPFAGRLGIRQVDLGQYVNPGAVLVTLQQLDPIYVDFTVPQQSLAAIKVGQAIGVTLDAFPGRTFHGLVQAIDAKVDIGTRNATIRASVPNADRSLLPGMYATVTTITGSPQSLLTIRQTSVAFNPFGSTAYVVEKGSDGRLTAVQTFIGTGATQGDRVAVLTGLKDGDTVVTAGQIKLHNGSEVLINNSIQPSDAINPKPGDR